MGESGDVKELENPSACGKAHENPKLHRKSSTPKSFRFFVSYYSNRLVDAIISSVLLAFTLCTGLGLIFAGTHFIRRWWFENALRILEILCPLTSIVLFASPMTVVSTAFKAGSSDGLPVSLFVVQSLCNLIGIDYGLKRGNNPVVLTNACGLLFQLGWLSSYHFLVSKNSRWVRFFVSAFGAAGLVLFSCRYIDVLLMGVLVDAVNILLSVSPLAKFGSILRYPTADCLPLTISLSMWVSNGVWGIYAGLVEDHFLLISSAAGYVFSLFQLIVIIWCRSWLPFDISFLQLFFTGTPEPFQAAQTRTGYTAVSKQSEEDVERVAA